MTDRGVVFDASALVEYARNDLRSLPVDELLDELEGSRGPVCIPWFAVEDAQQILGDDRAALARLQEFIAKQGVKLADAEMAKTVDLTVAEGGLSRGLAHAIVLAILHDLPLATYLAPLVTAAGADVRVLLDLDEIFRDE